MPKHKIITRPLQKPWKTYTIYTYIYTPRVTMESGKEKNRIH